MNKLQNPADCNEAKLLICQGRLNSRGTQNCGWGCMTHFASKCFQAAYASGRMLVLDEEFFGLKSHFKPLSNSCPYQDLLQTETIFQWPYNMTEKGTYSLDHLKRSQT